MQYKKFLITGHPRSGTGFMAKLMQRYGYAVGHERMQEDGMSSWMFAVNKGQVYGDRGLKREDYHFDYLIMTMRHPIDIISSTYYTENNRNIPGRGRSFAFRKEFVNFDGLNEVEIAVKSVLAWYRIIEAQKPDLTIYVDKDPEERLFRFFKLNENSSLQEPIPTLNRKVNARKHESIDMATIQEHTSKTLVEELNAFCNRHGYDT